jgi:membrane protein
MAKSIWRVIEQTFTRFSSNDGITLAAATAYYAAFSFFPLLYVLITALGFALSLSESAQDAKKELIEILAERTVPAFTDEVQRILADVELHAPRNAIFAWIILMFGAIGIFSQMEFAFDRLWHDPARPEHGIRAAIVNALWNRLKAFLALLLLGVLLIAVFIADLLLSFVHTWTDRLTNGTSLWDLMQLVFSLVLNAIVFALVYRLMPRHKVRWLHAVCGGAMVAIVWQVGSQVLSRIMLRGGYSAYGVVGSFIAVMLWIYCASFLLYLGGQLVQVLGNPRNLPPPTPAADP